ncbi:MAG: DUF4450 domain-containing protein [Candidatus Pedobacter colombiensis]|uniref:DUF4450 domain-containing protein n=1 Tax=Candidatus Pedobacter colombiensis TaxID=3121371 RepID=A0AAJ6B7D3_9SPHI|nr:DUF4450 domain-containing protein [Pedobacter sp.]WEK20145.1 MAG: DUF4450 domain-containing protein [Pedobacter sp.]
MINQYLLYRKREFYGLFLLLFFFLPSLFAQELYPPKLIPGNWHNEQRSLRYHPEGSDFVIKNGNRRFTRALYGTNTAFRVEAGDLPEFAMYMPGMGGNLKFGLMVGPQSKWLIEAEDIVAKYRAGKMIYSIKDPLLGNGTLQLEVLALSSSEGLIVKARFDNINPGVTLLWAFGGASGKNFSRNGDMGPDPESVFYLKAENCKDNTYVIKVNSFTLSYAKTKSLAGTFPSANLKIANAAFQQTPADLDRSDDKENPVLMGKLSAMNAKDFYFLIQNPDSDTVKKGGTPAEQFKRAEASRLAIADRVQINTPDPFMNTLGGTISMASDGIWEDPSYMHGAIGWRMRLNGWRGAYTADPLGWHDRARTHFTAYAKSQLLSPENGPVVADTALNLARSKEALGTAMFSSGYISRDPNGKSIRPHHYDMNLVYIDQLLWHFNWTGDLEFVREMWPLIKRHLAWEKRTFDPDDDGLYDAYAAIWASDALQYSGGAVTHSSAYNYRSNVIAAKIAKLLNEDARPYQKEADKILKAMNAQLWMPAKGWFAEYKDGLGLRQLHPAAALWTIYHSIDSDVPDAFQAWQSLRYVDTGLPHIAVKASGLKDEGYYTLSTTNWMPYEWSLNNVVLAESTHTALANWQAGRTEEAFKLWKSEILSSMYMGGSPGNFVQVSHYDASRGEAYRDFADPIGINSRTLVEGLFGIVPDALNHTLMIRPGLPVAWDYASLKIPDLSFDFKRTGNKDLYTLIPSFSKALNLKMRLKVRGTTLKSVKVNGQEVKWSNVENAIGAPEIEIQSKPALSYKIELIWSGEGMAKPELKPIYQQKENFETSFKDAMITKVFDPQNVLKSPVISGGKIKAEVTGEPGNRTVFVQLKRGMFDYWFPLCFELKSNGLMEESKLDLEKEDWTGKKMEAIDLSAYFNDKVTQIFNNKYLSPRPQTTTLQLPVQGVGDWPHPTLKPEINDSGLRKLAGIKNEIVLPSGIRFKTPGDVNQKNIIYTSQWDNYPGELSLPLSGKANAAFFLLAGSTNPMQSRMDNGMINILYTDGSTTKLALKNPENWWPIEKDLYLDRFAFDSGAPRPLRIHLKSGKIITATEGNLWNGKEIDGGAATALGIQLDPNKTLSKITLSALCNDVVIGLMALTLVR